MSINANKTEPAAQQAERLRLNSESQRHHCGNENDGERSGRPFAEAQRQQLRHQGDNGNERSARLLAQRKQRRRQSEGAEQR